MKMIWSSCLIGKPRLADEFEKLSQLNCGNFLYVIKHVARMEVKTEATPSTSTDMSRDYHSVVGMGIPLEIIFEHPRFKSMSIYRMRLDIKVPLTEIKEDLKDRLKTQPPFQQWFYRGVPIPETATLEERGVRENDKLLVKVDKTIQLLDVQPDDN